MNITCPDNLLILSLRADSASLPSNESRNPGVEGGEEWILLLISESKSEVKEQMLEQQVEAEEKE